jgi:RNA polymerase sigma-70 factor (ECF subfamily)
VPLTAADRQLLDRCLDHDQAAWREFVDRFLGLIYHVIQHSAHLRNQKLQPDDVEDVASIILAQIVDRDFALLRQFRGKCSLPAYLTAVARRICMHEMARRWAVREVQPQANSEGEEPAVEAVAPPPEYSVDNAEQVESLLSHLPPRERQVVRMFYIEGRTYDEISQELQIPRNSIGPILHRVRNELRGGSEQE